MKFFLLFSIISIASFASANLTTQTHKLIVPESVEKFKNEINTNSMRNGRLTSGFPVETAEQFPFIVDITVRWPDGSTTRCTGSLIADNWVITARRCLFSDELNRPGVTFLAEVGSNVRAAARTAVFAEWAIWKNGVAPDHPDYALFRLSEAVTISETINIVRLPTVAQIDDWFERRPANIIGWGETNEGLATQLQFSDIIISSRGACTRDIVQTLTTFEMCGETSAMLPTRMMSGDAGAAVIIIEAGIPTLIGVGSRNHDAPSLPNSNVIGVTRIGQFLEFIWETTGIEPRTL